MRTMRIGWLRPTFLYTAVAFFLFWTLAPVIWIAVMSVQPEINYVSVPPKLAWEDVSLRWFADMLFQPDFLHALRASTIVAVATMAVCLFFGSLAAYPLARLNIPNKNLFQTQYPPRQREPGPRELHRAALLLARRADAAARTHQGRQDRRPHHRALPGVHEAAR